MSNDFAEVTKFFKPEFSEEVIDAIKTGSQLRGINTSALVRHLSITLQANIDIGKQEETNILEFFSSYNKYTNPPLRTTEANNIYIFGAGGTSSWFLPKLLKVCNHYPDCPFNIILVDGDVVRRYILSKVYNILNLLF